jgi:GNAT superfamily N-acetyltransferase
MHIRRATPDDAEALAALHAAYLAEMWPDHPGVTAEVLRRDVLSGDAGQHVLVAEREGRMIGFAAWDRIYDMHWAARGVQVADLYVEPASRGHGVALAMLAAVCAAGRAGGAVFLRGHSYDRASPTGRFYERIAVGFDTSECNCAGRAFRTLAELHGQPVRTILRSLPAREANFEA